ncbi:hydroxyethylthiazole kinase [uncultured Streptococcus sp.]|uniref:hydroxyethylthiazole kinase n=1 Tax=Streptococcus sp. HJ1 TaxID=3458239 RepID=UPI0028E46BDC|nr:hydroxyethylthiazole kinase [uncultured Streptococcus sp.]
MTSLKLLKEKAPLVICITNDVVKNFTANGLVALGASPAMSEYPADLEDLLKYAGGLLINIGTLTDNNWKLYQEALKIAEKYNVPAVLDPVACGAGEYRKKVADDLINNYKLAAIRGNAGEIASLVGINVASKGVDSAGVDNIDEIALAANKKFNIPIVVTGEVDAIAVNGEVVTIHNGSAMMPKVIGTGCLLGAVVASFIGLEKGQELKSLETAMLVHNIAGEMAEKRPNGHLPGTFKVEFINALYEITDEDVKEFKRVK